MITKQIDESQRKSRMILQRDFVIMRFILRGNTSANMRITAMKITCMDGRARETTMPRYVGKLILATNQSQAKEIPNRNARTKG